MNLMLNSEIAETEEIITDKDIEIIIGTLKAMLECKGIEVFISEPGKTENEKIEANMADMAKFMYQKYLIEGPEGFKASYECGDLIDELRSDIAEFGEEEPCWLFYKIIPSKIPFLEKYVDIEYCIDYAFIVDEHPLTEEQIDGCRIVKSTFAEALKIFEEQNKII